MTSRVIWEDCFKRMFTSWTTKLSHDKWPLYMVTLHGQIYEKCKLIAFGPLTRCKPNVDQEE